MNTIHTLIAPSIQDALVQFAGEVIRLNAMLDQIEVARLEENRERYGAA